MVTGNQTVNDCDLPLNARSYAVVSTGLPLFLDILPRNPTALKDEGHNVVSCCLNERGVGWVRR
jgi:hypothetical protein